MAKVIFGVKYAERPWERMFDEDKRLSGLNQSWISCKKIIIFLLRRMFNVLFKQSMTNM